MRKINTLLLLCFAFVATAQEPLTFSDVVTVEGVLKKEMYGRAKLWFVEYYKSAKDVIQADDPEIGQIAGRALFYYQPKGLMASEAVKGNVKYIVKVFVKDGKYKVDVESFYHEKLGEITTDEEAKFKLFGNSQGVKNKIWKEIKQQCKDDAEALMASLKKSLNKKSDSDF
jgi:Domain of unknown function (DUF4468) with TBP-like fold